MSKIFQKNFRNLRPSGHTKIACFQTKVSLNPQQFINLEAIKGRLKHCQFFRRKIFEGRIILQKMGPIWAYEHWLLGRRIRPCLSGLSPTFFPQKLMYFITFILKILHRTFITRITTNQSTWKTTQTEDPYHQHYTKQSIFLLFLAAFMLKH